MGTMSTIIGYYMIELESMAFCGVAEKMDAIKLEHLARDCMISEGPPKRSAPTASAQGCIPSSP